MLTGDYPEAAEILGGFADFVLSSPLPVIEEVYLKTFHIQSICYLDIGYMMFGEDYKRGEFLVNMKLEQQRAGNDCGNDLPDNLVNVLTLIPKLTDRDFIEELSVRIIIPAIKRMLAEFEPSRISMKMQALRQKHKAILRDSDSYGNIYVYALKALLITFEKDFSGIQFEEMAIPALNVNSFIGNCVTCSIAKQPQR